MNTTLRITRVLRTRSYVAPQMSAPRRTLITLKEKTYYTGYATAKAASGGDSVEIISVKGNEAGIDLPIAVPKSLGGNGEGHNPEQLLAAGHASCLLMTLQDIAHRKGRTAEIANTVIHAEGVLGKPTDKPGRGFQVNLKFEGVPHDLVDAAHEACPFSRMEREGIVTNVIKA